MGSMGSMSMAMPLINGEVKGNVKDLLVVVEAKYQAFTAKCFNYIMELKNGQFQSALIIWK